jgi:phenylacetate-coenzyme A ligase PaaK-like adenylate-forming protein
MDLTLNVIVCNKGYWSLPSHSILDRWIAEKTGLGDSLNPVTLSNWQFSRLRDLLFYVKKRSKFYEKKLAYINSADISGPDCLALIPLTSTGDLLNDGPSFVCLPQKDVTRIVTLNTSGTSGLSKRLYFSEKDQELSLEFFALGIKTMAEPGDTVRIYLGEPSPGNLVDLLCRGLARSGIRAIAGDMADADHTLNSSEKANCDCLLGMPVWILRMAKNNPDLRPKTVIMAADYPPQAAIKSIKSLWGCKIFTHYGSTESGLGGAVSCVDNGELHTRAADLLFEVIDPQTGLPAPDGGYGEVVFTTLNREAMPLIRYRTGDISRMIKTPCRCGSTLPRLDAIQGRYDNFISSPGSAKFSIHQLDEVLFSLSEVLDYTAELGSDNLLQLTIQTNDARSDEKLPGLVKSSINYGLTVKVKVVHSPLPFNNRKRAIRANF